MIAITGISGLAGANLARALLARGQTVRGLIHNDRRAVVGLELELVEANIRDFDSLVRAFEGADVVYHLAAAISLSMNSWQEVEAVNVQGTRNVVEACLRCGVRRLVHFSTVHAIQKEPFDQPLVESRPRVSSANGSPYDYSKALGEQIVHEGISRGLQAVILNPTGMIGPYDYYPSFFGQGLLAMVSGRVPALVEGGFDWVDVRDVVQAALCAAEVAPNGSSYILSGHWRSIRQISELAARLTGTNAPLMTVPMGLAELAAPLMIRLAHFTGGKPIYTRATLDALRSNRHVSSARAEHELGYSSRPFEETLADTLAWFHQNGYLKLSTKPGSTGYG